MANEADTARDVAVLTDRIAQAMHRTRATLDYVADTLSSDIPRALERRLEDAQTMTTGATRVGEAEREADRQGEVATRTQDHYEMRRWTEADQAVRAALGSSREDAGSLGSGIGATQRELVDLRDDVSRSTYALDEALRDVDALEQLPGYDNPAQSEGLRTRLNNLKSMAGYAESGLTNAVDRLETGRRAALDFENYGVQVGEGRAFQAAQTVGQSLQSTVTDARDGLRDLGRGIDVNQGAANSMAAFGVDEATKAAQLAESVRAATNPTPRSEQQAGRAPGAQDLRHRLEGGPSQDNSLKR